jgi:hypothetical protein
VHAYAVLMGCDITFQPQPRKRRKLAKHIPQDKYSVGKRDAEVVELADIQYDFALLDAQLELVKRDPTLLGSIGRAWPTASDPTLTDALTRIISLAGVSRGEVSPGKPVRPSYRYLQKP